MSALPPKADIRPRDQDVCFGPTADIVTNTRMMLIDIAIAVRVEPDWPQPLSRSIPSQRLARQGYAAGRPIYRTASVK